MCTRHVLRFFALVSGFSRLCRAYKTYFINSSVIYGISRVVDRVGEERRMWILSIRETWWSSIKLDRVWNNNCQRSYFFPEREFTGKSSWLYQQSFHFELITDKSYWTTYFCSLFRCNQKEKNSRSWKKWDAWTNDKLTQLKTVLTSMSVSVTVSPALSLSQYKCSYSHTHVHTSWLHSQ